MSDSIHIHAPSGWTYRAVLTCHRCRARRRHIVTIYVWYGPTVICCRCGARRNDGMLHRARKDDTRQAVKAAARWATALTRADALRLRRAEIDLYAKET